MKKIKIVFLNKDYTATLEELTSATDVSDKVYKCNIEGFMEFKITKYNPTVGTAESQDDFDFIIDIILKNQICNRPPLEQVCNLQSSIV